MPHAPACGEHEVPHDAQPAHGFIPQQQRGQECHITHKTSAWGETRASLVLELVQGHSLLVALDISHTIVYEKCEAISLPWCHCRASHRVGTHSGGTHPPWGPTAVLQHGKALLWTDQCWDHCHLVTPGWHCLAACMSILHSPHPPGWQPVLCPSVPQGMG